MALGPGFSATGRQNVLVASEAGGAGALAAARILAISQDGCRLALSEEFPPRSRLSIMFPGFRPRAAVVVGSEKEAIQCRFDEPLPDAIFDYLVRMSDSTARG